MENHCFDDIVFEILTWLPAKSLMRFNCISKAWNTLIRHDPNFVKSHIARSQARPSATCLLFELEVRPDSQEVNVMKGKGWRLEGFSLELLTVTARDCFYDKEMRICSNHCNGLVCLYSVKDTQTYLFNVTTGEIKALPFYVDHVSNVLFPPKLYLGFDMLTEKYKLLYIFVETTNNNRVTKARILTLGTDSSWRNLHMPSIRSVIMPLRCFFLNGVVYWVQYALTYFYYFNLREEEFGSFSLLEYGFFAFLNDIQTALRGKLVLEPYKGILSDNWIYDHELNKVHRDLNNPANIKKEMFAFFEAEKIAKLKPARVLPTSSIINAPDSFVFPRHFLLKCVSRFVENIIPLSFLV